ncbi:MAG: hypothetical protein ACRD96_09050 [Bryobacteraceae bacterium]
MDQESDPRKNPPQLPDGMYNARVDEKGRLKLPQEFIDFFKELTDKKLFVTSLDRRIGQIYTTATWEKNKQFLLNYRANARVAQNVAFNANDLGGNAEMDNQGRILLPPEMRRELGLENESVRIFQYKGRVEIYGPRVYGERKRRASATPEADAEFMEQEGLD